jgi:WD40 repeat protein
MISCSNDKTIRLFNNDKSIIIKKYNKKINFINVFLQYSKVIICSNDNIVDIFDTNTSKIIDSKIVSNISSLSFNGEYIAFCLKSGLLKIWNIIKGFFISNCNITSQVCFKSNSNFLIFSCFDNTIRIWNVKTRDVEYLYFHEKLITIIKSNINGDIFLTCSLDKKIVIWKNKNKIVLNGHNNTIKGCDFSPDSLKILSWCLNNTIIIWNTNNGEKILFLNKHTQFINYVCFSPNSYFLASCSDDETIIIVNINTNKYIQLKHHTDFVNCVDFSSDSKKLVSCSFDKTIIVFDIVLNKIINSNYEHNKSVNFIYFLN